MTGRSGRTRKHPGATGRGGGTLILPGGVPKSLADAVILTSKPKHTFYRAGGLGPPSPEAMRLSTSVARRVGIVPPEVLEDLTGTCDTVSYQRRIKHAGVEIDVYNRCVLLMRTCALTLSNYQ